jgi:DNA-binding MarR family transcriptional regulator
MQDAVVRSDVSGDDATTSAVSAQAIMGRFLRKPGFLLARIDQICTLIYGEISAGETLAQAEFLLLLDALGAVSQITLARAAGVDKSTTAYVLDNLQIRGWIERAACSDDRRRILVSLLPAGASRIRRIRSDYAELQRRLVLPLHDAEITRLVAALHKLGSNSMSPAPLWTPACDPAVGVLDGALSFLSRRALQLFQAQFVACTPGLNLTLRQFSLLFILSLHPSITQVGFARLFGLDPSTCGVILRGLTSRGLIVFGASPRDRRERLYSITPAGRAVLIEVQPLVDRSERLVFRGDSAAQIRWMVRQLQAIVCVYSHRLRFPGAIGGS